MLVDLGWIREKYRFFNDLLWGGDLPSIAFKTNNSTRVWGYASYRFNTWNNTVTPVSITISNKYDSPENIKLGVLIHEMIHIADYTFHPEHFVRYGKKVSKRSYDAHGYVYFLPEMNRANKILKENGFDIVVSPNVQQSEVDASVLNPQAQARIAAKKERGTTIFIYRLTKDGRLAYSYCQSSQLYNWRDYIKHNNWWSETRMWTDEYVSHSEAFALLRSLSTGSGRYMGSSLEDFINKYNLTFVSHLQGNNDEGTISRSVEKPSPVVQSVSPRLIPLFRFQTTQGNTFELRNTTKDEIRTKLHERFPKWSDEVIERMINNEKCYPLKEMKTAFTENDIKEMVAEAVEQIMGAQETEPVGQRRSKPKQISQYEYIESIE